MASRRGSRPSGVDSTAGLPWRRVADGSRAPIVDRDPCGRAGCGRGPAGRRTPHPAPADPLDRGDRPSAPGLADVRRRHRRAAARAAPACDRARAPPVRAASPGRRSRTAARPAHLLCLPDCSSLRPYRVERGREPSGKRHLWGVDLRDTAGGAPPDVARGPSAAPPRRFRPVARPFLSSGRSARRASPSPPF